MKEKRKIYVHPQCQVMDIVPEGCICTSVSTDSFIIDNDDAVEF